MRRRELPAASGPELHPNDHARSDLDRSFAIQAEASSLWLNRRRPGAHRYDLGPAPAAPLYNSVAPVEVVESGLPRLLYSFRFEP